MATLHRFEGGGYAFVEGGFPYSQGVAALPGCAIVRERFREVIPMAEGFAAIEARLAAVGRPLTALCSAELRSPRPFSFEGFRDFNKGYVDVLTRWGLYRDGLNPVARSNVCPQFDAPAQPGFFAFSYTAPATEAQAPRSFVVAGSGEWPEDQPFPEGIVARGDASAAGLARKAAYVLATMRERTEALECDWGALSAVQVYTVHDIHPLLAPQFAAQRLTGIGLTWHVCRPPIEELEFEMDVRNTATEHLLGVP